jgi:hypothetical protein
MRKTSIITIALLAAALAGWTASDTSSMPSTRTDNGYFDGLGTALCAIGAMLAFVFALCAIAHVVHTRREARSRLKVRLPAVMYNTAVHADPPRHRKVPRPSDKEVRKMADEITTRRRTGHPPKDIN